MKFKGKSIKSQSGIITAILIILVCLVAIFILWKVVFPMTQSTQEETQIRQDLMNTKLGIDDVSGDLANPEGDTLAIKLSRGSEKIILKNTTINKVPVQIIPESDIVFSLDVSSSMDDAAGLGFAYLNCTAKVANPPITGINDCCVIHDCSTPDGCAKCNRGFFNTSSNTCYMLAYVPYCCNPSDPNGHDCSTISGCNFCINITNKTSEYAGDHIQIDQYCTDKPNSFIDGPCTWSQEGCETVCNGKWLGGDAEHWHTCQAIPGVGCCSGNDCQTQIGCQNCNNGEFDPLTKICNFTSYTTPCCKGKDCSHNETQCESICGYSYTESIHCIIKGYVTNYYSCVDSSEILNKKSFCENQCEGNFALTTKLNFTLGTLASDGGFIDSITQNPKNALSFVAYAGNIDTTIPLRNNASYLKSSVETLSTDGTSTNICQGLNKSIYILNTTSTKLNKVIILVTDGMTNVFCNGTSIPTSSQSIGNDEVKNIAASAKNSGINVYTIGIGANSGSSLDESFLNAVAIAGNGTYYYSNVTDIKNTLTQIIKNFINVTETYYEPVQNSYSLRFVVYNETNSYVYNTMDIPDPLETKDITIKTGGLTNINKIEVYIVVHREDGKEISELITTWNPNSKDSDYLPSY